VTINSGEAAIAERIAETLDQLADEFERALAPHLTCAPTAE
jgi:hypothetical protein